MPRPFAVFLAHSEYEFSQHWQSASLWIVFLAGAVGPGRNCYVSTVPEPEADALCPVGMVLFGARHVFLIVAEEVEFPLD